MSPSNTNTGGWTSKYIAAVLIACLSLGPSVVMANSEQQLTESQYNLGTLETDMNEVVGSYLRHSKLGEESFTGSRGFINCASDSKTADELKNILGKLQLSIDRLSEKLDVLKTLDVVFVKDVDKSKKLYAKRFYVDTEEKVIWNTAREKCKSLEMRLATIRSQEEQDEVVRSITATGNNITDNNTFWISGRYNDKLNKFEWHPQRELVTYTNWRDGQPSHVYYDLREDCLSLEPIYNYKWNDANCDYRRNFICEYYENS